MKVEEVLSCIEEVAPLKLSHDFCKNYGLYDNSGIIVNCGKPVTGVLFCLDLTESAVDRALSLGYNVIATHHPAIYGGISKFDLTSDPQSCALAKCMEQGISVISMHLNCDSAKHGIDYYLMKGLGGKSSEVLCPLPDGGYGRVYEVKEADFLSYCKSVEKEFNTNRLIAYGNWEKRVKKVASFCGAGCDDKAISFAFKNGADVFVSSDMKHHEVLALTQRGINVIVLTHYASENYGFEKIYFEIKDGLKTASAYFTQEELL